MEIIFRAWDNVDKVMLYPLEQTYMIGKEKNKRLVYMLYTGIRDSEGKRIWDGDILLVDWQDSRYKPYNVVVSWDTDYARWDFPGGWAKHDAEYCFTVIGNIYENPELIESEV